MLYNIGDIVKLSMKNQYDDYSGDDGDDGYREWQNDRIEPHLMGMVVEIVEMEEIDEDWDSQEEGCDQAPYLVSTITERGDECEWWIREAQISRKF